MKQSKCYTCEKITPNLLNVNCGHKICFNCVKNNKNTHKCAYCSLMSVSRNKITNAFSPLKKQKPEKEKTTKTKSIQSKRHDESSPLPDKSTRKTQLHIQSCSNYIESSTFQDPTKQIKLLCKEHHQPLTLFSKSTKQAICSMCLCSRPKFNQEIMPIKGAQSFLKRQNHIQRQESRVILNDIEKCYKVMKINHEKFQLFYGSHVKVLGEVFSQLHKQLEQKEREIRSKVDAFFVKKLRQCQQIEQDLSYLIQTLQTYRQQNKESNTLTESLYVYSSFKVIKKTMKTLNLDYVSYANKNVNLLEYNKNPYRSALGVLIKFNQDLPLKHQQVISITKRRNRSTSSHQKVSAQKESNGYSNRKKGSIAYQNVLNQKIGLGPENYPQVFKRNEQSQKKKASHNYSYQQLSRPQHSNSLHSYIHQNLEEQREKPRHSNSTYTYFNQPGIKGNTNQNILSSSNAFDYELKTPIKNILNKNQKSLTTNGFKHIGELENQENVSQKHQIQRSYDNNSKKNNDFNIFSTSSINQGLNLNEQEKSLYKRLLKSRFNKNLVQNQQQIYIQTEQKQTQIFHLQVKTEHNERNGYQD